MNALVISLKQTNFHMRTSHTNKGLKVNVVAGTYVVVLGINLTESKCNGLLGFSIHRIDHIENEAYYLEGMKAFALTDPGFPSGSLYSTRDHPIQSFQWADYSAKPGYHYTYTIAALKGTPDHLTEFAKTSVEVTTEKPETATGNHNIYFNRGTPASQEYVRRFGDKIPDMVPNNQAYDWLSRGLYEAMKDFITSCQPGIHSLRIAAYEFNYEPFLQLINTASVSGVDIQIVFDERGDKPGKINRQLIDNNGLHDICTGRVKGKSYISHNKFIVKLENGQPKSLWTGGTNFSDGGIFGHSNVAHVVEVPAIAALYLAYWEELAQDPTNATLRNEVEQITSIPPIPVPVNTSVLFSPRHGLDALNFYGQLAMTAKHGLFMTFAFGLHQIFKDVYKNSTAPFRLALLEKTTRPMEDGPEKELEEKAIQILRNLPENVFAVGDFIATNEFDGWVKEKLTGLNSNVRYVHNKFMLIDPMSNDPIVVAGSANFSEASTEDNDENMIIVRGNKRVADIYLGEFMRLFTHHSFRESLKWRRPDEPPKPLRTDDWWKDSFGNTPRSSRRKYFAKVSV